MRLLALGGYGDFHRLPVADVPAGIVHLDFDAEGAGGRVGRAADECHLALDLGAGGEAGHRRRAACHPVDLGFGHEAHENDRIELDDRGAQRAGLQQCAEFGGVGFQKARERRADLEALDLLACGCDGGIRGLDSRARGFDPGTGRLDGRLRRGDPGFGGEPVLAQARGGAVVDLRLGQARFGLRKTCLGFGQTRFGLDQGGQAGS